MTEPVYEYVKGEGWVIRTIVSASGTVGKQKVTIEKRFPEIGEYYTSYSSETTPQDVLDSLQRDSWYNNHQVEGDFVQMNSFDIEIYKDPDNKELRDAILTVLIEDGPEQIR